MRLTAFQPERHFLDSALIRGNELAAEKYQSQLYGLNAINDEARKPIEAAADAKRTIGKTDWRHKAQALFEQQSPELKAADTKLNEEAAC